MNTTTLIQKIQKYDFLILDFDDTIVSLHLDWNKLRKELLLFLHNNYGFNGESFRIHEMVNKAMEQHGEDLKNKLIPLFLKHELSATFSINILWISFLQKHPRWAILSNNCRESIQKILKQLHLNPLAIIGYQDVSYFKPYPAGLNTIIDNFQLSRKNTLFIGDKETDRQTASQGSVPFIKIEKTSLTPYIP